MRSSCEPVHALSRRWYWSSLWRCGLRRERFYRVSRRFLRELSSRDRGPKRSSRGVSDPRHGNVTRFAKGQYVELYPTIPSSFGGSVDGGTRGIVQDVDETRPEDDVYLVGFLSNERLTGEAAWLREIDLFSRVTSDTRLPTLRSEVALTPRAGHFLAGSAVASPRLWAASRKSGSSRTALSGANRRSSRRSHSHATTAPAGRRGRCHHVRTDRAGDRRRSRHQLSAPATGRAMPQRLFAPRTC